MTEFAVTLHAALEEQQDEPRPPHGSGIFWSALIGLALAAVIWWLWSTKAPVDQHRKPVVAVEVTL